MAAYQSATSAEAMLGLIDDDAVYMFSNETVHVGREAIEQAIRHNFETIKDDTYAIKNLTWLVESSEVAVCVYDFAWTGTVHGKPASGSGRGTSVLRRTAGGWKIVHEHLSKGKFAS